MVDQEQPEFIVEYIDLKANPQTTLDDCMPGDRGATHRDPAGTVTRVREYKGFTLKRTNPHSFWTIGGLESLGGFTDQVSAQQAIDVHLGDKDAAAAADRGRP